MIPVYKELLSQLKEEGVEYIQVDEPILVLEVAKQYSSEYISTYAELVKVSPKIALTTYFGRLDDNVSFAARLPIHELHIDLDREPRQLESIIAAIKGTSITLSLGLVSGRNIWKNDFATSQSFSESCRRSGIGSRHHLHLLFSSPHTHLTRGRETFEARIQRLLLLRYREEP